MVDPEISDKSGGGGGGGGGNTEATKTMIYHYNVICWRFLLKCIYGGIFLPPLVR